MWDDYPQTINNYNNFGFLAGSHQPSPSHKPSLGENLLRAFLFLAFNQILINVQLKFLGQTSERIGVDEHGER